MSEQIQHTATIPEEAAGQRIDRVLAQLFPQYSRACLQNWLKSKNITVDGKNLPAKAKVKGGESVIIEAALVEQQNWQAQPIDFAIVYEDDDILVINKPAGLVVHPAAGNPDQTLLNGLIYHDATLAYLPRCGIVHRLDKDTTGLMVVAKTLSAHSSLVQQLQARTMHRQYHAIVQGTLTVGSTVNAPVARHPHQRIKMAVVEGGKLAITHYRILQRFPVHTHLQLNLETGRTHQIRVHMAHIKHPIVGDPVYGARLKLPPNCSEELKNALQNFSRQALHAQQLKLQHPITKELMSWTCELPEDMRALLDYLMRSA